MHTTLAPARAKPDSNPLTPPAAPAASTTLTKSEYHVKRLRWLEEDLRDSDALYKLALQRKPGPNRDALFSGAWALKHSAEAHVERIVSQGCLLHIGAKGALA